MDEVEEPVSVGGGRGANTPGHSRATHLGSKVFQDGGAVDCRRGSNPAVAGGPIL